MWGVMNAHDPKRGRGTGLNPTGRFEELKRGSADGEHFDDPDPPNLRTTFFTDSARSIVTRNESPDVGFDYGINPYRGCEHGCVYCYARPTHEYLGLSAGEDFESKIFVKTKAPELLRERLMSRSWEPRLIVSSGNTDCYQPAERSFRLTRACLEVLAEFRNPVFVITKNHLVTRDIDVLAPMAADRAAMVMISVTSLDDELCASMEPRTSRPAYRLDAIRRLAQAGIPVAVNVAPLIAGLTDEEMPRILQACAEAGARYASFTPLRLPFGVKDLFEDWIRRFRPDRADKVLRRIRELRGGKLNDADFGSRMRGQGVFAEQIRALFHVARRKAGLESEFPTLSTAAFRRPTSQLSLL